MQQSTFVVCIGLSIVEGWYAQATELHTKANAHMDLHQAHHNAGLHEQHGGADLPPDDLVIKFPVHHDSITGRTYAIDGDDKLDITGLTSTDPVSHPVHSPYAKHCVICYWSGHQYADDGIENHHTPHNCRVARENWAKVACRRFDPNPEAEAHPDCYLPAMHNAGSTDEPMHLDECEYGLKGDDQLAPGCLVAVHASCEHIQLSAEAHEASMREAHAPPPEPVRLPTEELAMCHECDFHGHNSPRCFREVERFVEGTCHNGGEHSLCKAFGKCDVASMDWRAYSQHNKCQRAVRALCSLKQIQLPGKPPRSVWAQGHDSPATFEHEDGPHEHEHHKDESQRKVPGQADDVEHLLQQGEGQVRRPGHSHGDEL